MAFFDDFCKNVVLLDKKIRFAGIADGDGTLEGVAERPELVPVMKPEERAQYAITAATRQYTRLRWEYLLGKISYASSHYTKLIRATIPIADENRRLAHVLLLSFDPDADDFHNTITKKIIPFIKQNMEKLMQEAQK
ncbi:MAG: hypothetical protein KGH95_04455 [Thaumarchaeota archaeon]|nr:hypothetical protein [Nitrososphaerota archaeon]